MISAFALSSASRKAKRPSNDLELHNPCGLDYIVVARLLLLEQISDTLRSEADFQRRTQRIVTVGILNILAVAIDAHLAARDAQSGAEHFAREVFTRSPDGAVSFHRCANKDVPDWVLGSDVYAAMNGIDVSANKP